MKKVITYKQFVLIVIALWVGMAGLAAQGAMPADDPRLINITTLEQLNAIRYDLNGNGRVDQAADVDKYNGTMAPFTSAQTTCTGGCQGYELRNNLDFDDEDHLLVGLQLSRWAKHAGDPTMHPLAGGISVGGPPSFRGTPVPGGWVPIGGAFVAIFEGNGYTISNLYINTSTLSYVGLFGVVRSTGQIQGVGIVNGNVTGSTAGGGNAFVGGLLGVNDSGTISACYATGAVTGSTAGGDGGNAFVGGLLGVNDSGTISACYATGSVTGSTAGGKDAVVGGLVGINNSGTTRACYAMGGVRGSTTGNGNSVVGGLLGYADEGTTSACYATGSVTGSATGGGSVFVGGLLGGDSSNITITASYFDKGEAILTINRMVQDDTPGKEQLGIGTDSKSTLLGKTRTELQSLTAYNHAISSDNSDQGFLYRDWYKFGENGQPYWSLCGSDQYPRLRVDFNGDGTPSVAEFGSQGDCSAASTPLPLGATPPVALMSNTEQIKVLGAKVATLEGLDLSTKVPDLGTRLTALDNTTDGKVVALETSQTAQDTKITAIETSQTAQDTKITAIETSQTAQDTKTTAIETSQTAQDTKTTAIETSQTAQDTKITAIETSQTAQDTKTTAIETSQTAQDTKITAIETSQTAQDTKIATLETSQTAQDTKIAALESSSTSRRELEMTFHVPQRAGDKAALYPNPAARLIRFTGLSAGGRYSYALYSLGGSKALAGSLERERIDIGEIPAGHYILVLKDEGLTELLREAIMIE